MVLIKLFKYIYIYFNVYFRFFPPCYESYEHYETLCYAEHVWQFKPFLLIFRQQPFKIKTIKLNALKKIIKKKIKNLLAP